LNPQQNTPRVLSRRHDGWAEAVYVGRPGKWGNPFKIGRDGNRDEVIALFEEWITQGDGRYLLDDLAELRGRDLACWCAPDPCHADVLLRLANEESS
jgi:hypothetical protein